MRQPQVSLSGAVAGFVSGFAAGSLEPLDRVGDRAGTLGKTERILEIIGGGQQVRVRPQGVSRLGSSLGYLLVCLCRAPQSTAEQSTEQSIASEG